MIETGNNQASQKGNELPVKRLIAYGVIGIILTLLQVSVVDLIAVGFAVPDLVLILVVWIGVYEGYMEGILYGFALGLLFDIFTFDTLGTNALAKLIVGLFSGFFHKKDTEKQLTAGFRFLPIIFIAALMHNVIYGIFRIEINNMNFIRFFLEYSVASAIYTTAFGIFAFAIGSGDRRRPGT